MSSFSPDYVLYVSIFTILANSFFGVTVFLHDRSNALNRIFFSFTLLLSLWAITNFFSLYQTSAENTLWWVRIVLANAIIMFMALYFLCAVFVRGSARSLSWYSYLIVLVSLLTAVISLSPLVFRSIAVYEVGSYVRVLQPYSGPLLPLYGLVVIGLQLMAIINLVRRYRRTEPAARRQIGWLMWGVILTSVLTTSTNFILVNVFNDASLVVFGPFFTLFFVAFAGYALIKHHLFGIRVAATEILTFVLTVVTLLQTIFSRDLPELLLRSITLLLTLIFGIFFIRSVIKEIRQREQLEKLTQELQVANNRLQELDKLKSEFLSFASHQLRSPITSIKGYASLIIEGSYGKVPKKMQEALERIFSAGSSLAKVVDDFLNISRIEQGRLKFTFAPTDVRELLEQIVGEQEPAVAKAGLKLTKKIAVGNYIVPADKDKLRQVFANLVDNAIKYTPNGTIVVGLARSDKRILLSISDSGIGFASTEVSRLFEKFERAKNAQSQNMSGTGLGLYLARVIVKAHHGRIWAESGGEGKGSTFFVELPLTPARIASQSVAGGQRPTTND